MLSFKKWIGSISGYEEDYFLQSLNVTYEDLEPLADGCTQVKVQALFGRNSGCILLLDRFVASSMIS